MVSRAWVIAAVGGGMLFMSGCATGSKQAGDGELGMGVLDTEITEGQIVERFDLNGDGKPDVWKVYTRLPADDGGSVDQRRLIRKDLDINFDTRIDIRKHYAPNGELVKEEMDLDFDGRVDAVSHYREGQLFKREMDMAFDGTTDMWKYYENGQLIRKERDANQDGQPDFWEYYQDGNLVRIGKDMDGDGQPEHFEDTAQK